MTVASGSDPRSDQSSSAGAGISAETARRYKARFPWSNLSALEVSLRIASSHNAMLAACHRRLAETGFWGSFARYGVLRALLMADAPSLSQIEVSRRMNLTPASVTRLIDSLEKDGLVRRVVNPLDRRAVQLGLTSEGLELSEKLVPAVAHLSDELCEDFTDEEARLFNEFLDRFQRKAESLDQLNERHAPPASTAS